MTVIIFASSPVIAFGTYSLVKRLMRYMARHKAIKLLRDSGVEHAVVTDDYIKF